MPLKNRGPVRLILTSEDVLRHGAATVLARAYLLELLSTPVIATYYSLASGIGISPNTVRKAFMGLRTEGAVDLTKITMFDLEGRMTRRTVYHLAGVSVDKEVYV